MICELTCDLRVENGFKVIVLSLNSAMGVKAESSENRRQDPAPTVGGGGGSSYRHLCESPQ